VDVTAFLVITALLYIVKDRLKDGLKSIYYKLALVLFPDYSTKILTPDQNETLGTLKESFTFLQRNQIPKDIRKLRDTIFHKELEEVRRPETTIYFKKEVILNVPPKTDIHGLKGFHDILRFNINQFILKAGDVFQEYLELDPKNYDIIVDKCPKVYHVNLIIQMTHKPKGRDLKTDIRKVRIILNKEGINRIEKIG
jgi:hypothetical protein